MREIKLKRMKLTNFKGLRSYELNFTDTTVILGDNATGKSTLFDAFLWLLFGKDAEDRKDYNIKTFDAFNKVIEKIDHEVEADILINGIVNNVKRCYREKWVTRRGESEQEMTGHETLFWWNEVPLQAGEYDRKVSEVFEVSATDFKLITNPLHFNYMKWQDRRELLTRMAGKVAINGFEDFTDTYKGKTLEEHRKEIAAKKKKLRSELDMIPARIDEVRRGLPEVEDWAAIESEIKDYESKISEVDSQILDAGKAIEGIVKGAEEKIKRINDLKGKVSKIEYENHQSFQQSLWARDNKIASLKSKIEQAERELTSRNQTIIRLKEKIALKTTEVDQLRKDWSKVNSEKLVFDPNSFFCPLCLREFEPEGIEQKKAEMEKAFNDDIKKRASDIIGIAEGIKAEIADMENEISAINISDLNTALDQFRKELEEASAIKLEKVPYTEEYHQAVKELSELESQKIEITQPDTTHLRLKRSGYQDRINIMKSVLKDRDQINTGNERLSELDKLEKSLAQQMADLEKTEYKIQEYVRAMVEAVETKVNTMFAGGMNDVKFKMFDIQINGGIAECCDTLVNGVPWTVANHAAQINSGIHIINVISKFVGVTAPIWIDNAEAINKIEISAGQSIELYVTKDKTLKVKHDELQKETPEPVQYPDGEGRNEELPFL